MLYLYDTECQKKIYKGEPMGKQRKEVQWGNSVTNYCRRMLLLEVERERN